MKSSKLLIGFLLILTYYVASAQKFIKTDINLKSNSCVMQAKIKGVSALPKYQFGPYKIVSGRAGWKKEISKHGLINDNVKTTAENKKSFVFVSHKKDTVNVQTSLNAISEMEDKNALVFRKLFGWHDYEANVSRETYISRIQVMNDSVEWSLVLIYPKPMQNGNEELIWDNKTQFFGILTDDSTKIEIRRVFEQENGKNSLLNPVWGYEFFLDGKSIAAFQDMPMNKIFVWIRYDLDDKLKTIVAASIASIFVR